MTHMNIFKKSIPLIILLIAAAGFQTMQAQLKEPEVRRIDDPLTPLDKGYRNSLSFNALLNNFGLGIGGQYTKFLGPYTELTFKTGITGIRDVSEQNFQDFFTGQRIIPNKYNRALGFPFLLGVKRRIFAQAIEDNFRFFVASSAGPALSFIYPYVDDADNNGLRNTVVRNGFVIPSERINDFFTGWSDGYTEWGFSGELKVGVDLGENFKRQTTIEFGYFFYYFDQGIQIMEPRKVVSYNQDGFIAETEPFFKPQKYFGTPQISIIFGGMW